MSSLYAVTGVTGKVGCHCANALLAANQRVRVIVRDANKGNVWAQRGCEVFVADVNDRSAMTEAMSGVDGVFLLIPPAYDIADLTQFETLATTLRGAIETAQPKRVVVLSTVGAQSTCINLLTGLTIVEKTLSHVTVPITFLRAAWFIENCAWDVADAKSGVISSYLQPIDKAIPMVATADIGRVAAQVMQQHWSSHRIVELEGPKQVSPNDVAHAFSKLLQRTVRAEAVPRDQWEKNFLSAGMKHPELRIAMLDGFNNGTICFEGPSVKGTVSLETVLEGLLQANDN